MNKRPAIQIIANAAELISTLAEQGPLSPAEAATMMNMPRSSTYRLVDGLIVAGLVEQHRDGKVRLSIDWLRLSDSARTALPRWEGADELLREVVDATGFTSFLSIRDEVSTVCIEWCRGPSIEVLPLKPGSELPLHAGAAGRTFLAYAADAEALLEGAPFGKLTEATLTSADDLRADIKTTRSRGFALAEQDVSVGIDAIGAPVRSEDGSVTACISISGLSRMFAGRIDDLGSYMMNAAHRLGIRQLKAASPSSIPSPSATRAP